MFIFICLFSCSPKDETMQKDSSLFFPELLFLHELWLNPTDPNNSCHPNEQISWTISLRLYSPHHARTRREEDMCSWYGSMYNCEIRNSTLPYSLVCNIQQTQSTCSEELSTQIQGSYLSLQIEELNSAQQTNLENLYRQQEKDIMPIMPYVLGVRSGIGKKEQAPFQEHGWAIQYKLENGRFALEEHTLILDASSQGNNTGMRIMGIAPSPFDWFWYD